MALSVTAVDQYIQAVKEPQTRVVESQRAILLQISERMVETTRREQRIFLFGTGHSHLLGEEGFYRAGGLANVVPILTEHLMLHHLPALGSRLERTPGLADIILDRYAPEPEEMLFVFSNSGDPFILRTPDGIYYCYATSAPDGFKAWSSTDLIHWTDIGYVYKRQEDPWGESDFWAPEVVLHDGKYFMHYSARWGKNQSLRIGVAIADLPTGPFTDMSNHPMFDFGYAAIDGHVLFDEDGRKYFYYSRDCSENIVDGRHESHLYVAELNDDLTSFKSDPHLITKPEQVWELNSGRPGWFWNEGPFVLKHNDRYYLMYSANFFMSRAYSVGYAVAESPMGPFIKAEHNPVLFTTVPEISGPGHNSVTTSPDGSELFIVYHIHTDAQKPSGDRQVCIDRMGFREDGSIYVKGPSYIPQNVPSMEK